MDSKAIDLFFMDSKANVRQFFWHVCRKPLARTCCCLRLSDPFCKAQFRDDFGAIPDERTWNVQWEFRMGVSEFSSSIMCFVLVEGGR